MAKKSAEDLKWETEGDVDAMERVAEVRGDKERLARCNKLIGERRQRLEDASGFWDKLRGGR